MRDADRARSDDLLARYLHLNTAWFGGRLPLVRLRVSRRMTSTAGQFDPTKGEIALAHAYLETHPDRVDDLLLHEMVHVGVAGGHGEPFRREWLRLREAGAPVPTTYRDFRHCPQFAPLRPRPFVYRCPGCGGEFPRTRAFRDARWCARCAHRARRCGEDPFPWNRRLVVAS